jgi:hypothetical protein
MIHAIRQWLFNREVRKVVFGFHEDWIRCAAWVAPGQILDWAFYDEKHFLRSIFPGAMIEIAEGAVTVVRGDLVARVEV